MNSIPMIEHCGFHQRQITRESFCPICGLSVAFLLDPERDYIGAWTCPNRCTFAVPLWRDLEPNDCPHMDKHLSG